MFYSYEHIESDIILELTINSSLEIGDILERLELANENLEDTFKCNAQLYLHAAVCRANPMAHTETYYCITLS